MKVGVTKKFFHSIHFEAGQKYRNSSSAELLTTFGREKKKVSSLKYKTHLALQNTYDFKRLTTASVIRLSSKLS